MSSRRLRWLPPALLLLVALNQHRLARVDDLTPWCGGGFGMFSTNDARSVRHVHALALGPGTRTELELPAALELQVESTAALPSQWQLEALARALAPYAKSAESEFEAPASIQIDVYTTRFAKETLAPSGELLRSLELPDARP